MNIFVLDLNPVMCAKYHCDKHVVKMITETAQLLSTALHLNNQTSSKQYKQTHINHPCTKWTVKSKSNYKWLKQLGECLYLEYIERYDKLHKAGEVLINLPMLNIKDIGLTDFALAMPEQYKTSNTVESYRNYYIGEKLSFLKYKTGNIPSWLKGYLN